MIAAKLVLPWGLADDVAGTVGRRGPEQKAAQLPIPGTFAAARAVHRSLLHLIPIRADRRFVLAGATAGDRWLRGVAAQAIELRIGDRHDCGAWPRLSGS